MKEKIRVCFLCYNVDAMIVAQYLIQNISLIWKFDNFSYVWDAPKTLH